MTDRARDRLGRPLPDGSPDAMAGIPVVDDLTDAQAWDLAVSYLDAGLPFHAHEVFEARWRTCPAPDRDAWRALAQWGAALTHAARGNTVGTARLAARTLQTLGAAASMPSCVDVPRVEESCRSLLEG